MQVKFKKKVLFVDDEIPKYGPQLKSVIGEAFDVICVQNPKEALEKYKFSELQPDLIVLDINFGEIWDEIEDDFEQETPDYIGVEVLQQFREMDPDIPIVILTGFKNLTSAFRSGEHNANLFLIKKETLTGKKNDILINQLLALLENSTPSHDRQQQNLAEEVAPEYRKVETTKPGTVAYWHFEEEQIVGIIKPLVDRLKRPVKVLDIGIGDGRFEQVLFSVFDNELEITGIDFSGKMLAQCKRHMSNEVDSGKLILKRCIAERLPLKNELFDLVIAGFGFLSYCNIDNVLEEIHRVATHQGEFFLGSYNFDALFYKVWSTRMDDENVPISGKIDRDRGLLYLGNNRIIKVRPTGIEETERRLRQHGFAIKAQWTFPVLYSTIGCDMAKPVNGITVDEKKYHNYSNFNEQLYLQDKLISDSLGEKGYYAIHHCKKFISE
ncbi:MAG: methyltransferase domain-containing protein [Deltaproteobacteria bacterium]|nr:methyltransferase domain-containing protein [Deltaproteobacteria bacterium]